MNIESVLLRRFIYEVVVDEIDDVGEEYEVNFVSDKMFCYLDGHTLRDIVIVKTEKYGNVAFYKRSGHGNGDEFNREQAGMLAWLPFGGLATMKENVERKNFRPPVYTAWGAEWLCKLPRENPEGDGTGKFLNKDGEFYKICLTLTQDFDKFKLVKVDSSVLMKQFFGKDINQLESLRSIRSNNFKLFYDVERLYNAIAINYCLKVKGALKEEWLPSSFVFTGSKEWGVNIGHDFETFREYIKSL